MDNRTNDGRDAFDDRLRTAAPLTTPLTAELDDRLLAMIVDAEREAKRTTKPRRLAWIGVGVGLGALVLGGGTAAAASGLFDWMPWAQTPDYAYSYRLPSGAVCETRAGEFDGADPVALQAVRDYAASVDVLRVADIDGEIAKLREQETIAINDRGAEVPGGYGTEYYNADSEYALAVSSAVDELIRAELLKQGFTGESLGISWEGQTHCPGAQW